MCLTFRIHPSKVRGGSVRGGGGVLYVSHVSYSSIHEGRTASSERSRFCCLSSSAVFLSI